MLARHRDKMATFLTRVGTDATNRKVVAFGRTAGDDHRVLFTLSNLAISSIDRSIASAAIRTRLVAAVGIAVVLGKPRQHGLDHTRIASRRGMVIKVDHRGMSDTILSGSFASLGEAREQVVCPESRSAFSRRTLSAWLRR